MAIRRSQFFQMIQSFENYMSHQVSESKRKLMSKVRTYTVKIVMTPQFQLKDCWMEKVYYYELVKVHRGQ